MSPDDDVGPPVTRSRLRLSSSKTPLKPSPPVVPQQPEKTDDDVKKKEKKFPLFVRIYMKIVFWVTVFAVSWVSCIALLVFICWDIYSSVYDEEMEMHASFLEKHCKYFGIRAEDHFKYGPLCKWVRQELRISKPWWCFTHALYEVLGVPVDKVWQFLTGFWGFPIIYWGSGIVKEVTQKLTAAVIVEGFKTTWRYMWHSNGDSNKV